MQLDPVTAERIKSLEKAKARAIDNEDFDEAKRIKEII